MLTTCELESTLKLNKIDCLSFIMAAVCHDIGHDGFTNSYHVNTISKRAIDSNDVSVQETYHVSEMFRILNQDKYNFTKQLSKDQFKLFRQRTIGFILATDMAKHATEVETLSTMLSTNEISDGQNINKLIDDVEES